MAVKTVYIYKVQMGHNGNIEETRYCYGRNAKTVIAHYKERLKEKKYDTYKLTAFGDVDLYRHSAPFEEMPKDEMDYITSHALGEEELYSNRKDNRIPPGGVFIPANKES